MLTLINSTYGTVKGYRRGSLVTLRIGWKSSLSGAWDTGNFGTLPESWRPPMDLNFSYGGRDGANQKSINVNANGTMTYANQDAAPQIEVAPFEPVSFFGAESA